MLSESAEGEALYSPSTFTCRSLGARRTRSQNGDGDDSPLSLRRPSLRRSQHPLDVILSPRRGVKGRRGAGEDER